VLQPSLYSLSGNISSDRRLSGSPINLSHRLEMSSLMAAVPDVKKESRGTGAPTIVARRRCLEAAMLECALVSIVDDDGFFRESMRKLVMLFGYTVETFPSAADFLASRFLLKTACLIADVQMPGMTGLELHGRLTKLGYAIPTILVTAYSDDVVRDQALKDGVIYYLSKPVDDGELERCLRGALRRGTPNEANS
jgi:CheY-like chemotaxis protein